MKKTYAILNLAAVLYPFITIFTHKNIISDVHHYNSIIYNNIRPHLSNHMLTPMLMHQQNKLKMKQYKSKNLIEASFNEI